MSTATHTACSTPGCTRPATTVLEGIHPTDVPAPTCQDCTTAYWQAIRLSRELEDPWA
ncbi:hypothetical protein [Nocardia farcinica]|uniref:hypothetical protein n=1 Tax=Nocardia farcinica TaxID=37329 RepID=UPI000DFA27F0|nr:hypothetical protein [Nocardia farcinica]SUE30908.1 Uncharacterised protein [Nocardia farcinica]